MGLSRLDNFLKSTRGTILYVDPSSLDATDSIENTGNSLTRPFKTIQRALIESARFSYQRGLDNDRFGKTTILLYPGEHIVDNRPGFVPFGSNQYYLRNGGTTNDLPPFDLNSNFDLDSPNNELYKLNSIHGGVILPRGTSIVGLDLRKTTIRPKYVPDPTNANIERSALFRLTGACYIWQFSMFDGDPNGKVYKDYTQNTFVPNFSHHKLTCFEYADGVNPVEINDTFLQYSTTRTDLDMYYEKVGLVYGQASGRQISPDYPSAGLDIQPKIDEFRIVGPTGGLVNITNIFAGDGTTPTTDITVELEANNPATSGLEVDTPFRIADVSAEYNGSFVVSEKLSATSIKYQVQNAPVVANPSATDATLALSSDTVTSASPYIFNVSLRSVFGMCGVHADGDKATGFRSMVIAQFTGIGLQKDDNAFVIYNDDEIPTGVYDDKNKSGNETLSTKSKARYKPDYRNFHVKVSNNSFIQAVSIFAIGYAEHFVTENGGDISLTNSNSNFGANALTSGGFRNTAFNQDNTAYISHIIPPKQVPLTESSLEFNAIDVAKTVGLSSTGKLFIYDASNADVPPENVIEGFRIGARVNDNLKLLVPQGGVTNEHSARIIMDGVTSTDGVLVEESTSEKSFNVRRVAGINSIGSNSDGGVKYTITLEGAHNFINGETVRVIGETGQIPDGLEANTVYNVITTSDTGISTNTNIKLAKTLNDALNDQELPINGNGGLLKIVSRVSDKNSGDLGHPIQYIGTGNTTGWYINVATASTENSVYSTIAGLGTAGLGEATSRTFVNRRNDNRESNDTLYRVRYVIPKDGKFTARPPVEGYILQETSTSIGSTVEIPKYFGSGDLNNRNDLRNFKFIADATWTANTATITTELPHNLSVGSGVQLSNIKSVNNTTAAQNSGFNRDFVVTGISSAKQFSVGLNTDPGAFTNDTTSRTTSLPNFKRTRYDDTYYVYRISETQKYISGDQDGIYYLTLLNASNSPTVTPFTEEKYSQPVKRMFPQTDRDNPVSDPQSSQCFADSETIGLVEINDPKKSITRETIDKFIKDADVGVGITDIVSSTGTAHTIHTNIDHGLNRVLKLKINGTGGSDYGTGGGSEETYYNARLVSIGASTTGKHATAKVTVSAAGTISDIIVMDGGSAYGIGNTMNVIGITTSGTSHTPAVVEVEKIYDNVGDVIRVTGVSSESYAGYNDLYRITKVGLGSDTILEATSASSVSNISDAVGGTLTSNAHLYLTGQSIAVSGIIYDFASGIATVNTSAAHGLRVDNKIRITGAGNTAYNGSFVVTENVTQTRFKVNIGVGTESPVESSSTIFALPEGFASQNGSVTINDENTGGRMVAPYAGITTTISGSVTTATGSAIPITGLNFTNSDIRIGDYLQVDDEIVRVKNTVAPGANSVTVYRGVLGTKATTHDLGAVIKRVKPFETELRRHSIIRASGHTFEYVGFGPGNYSTAFPDKHDRSISPDEELLAQSNKREGGINFYTGMNDKGISYSGNKKLSTITGREEIFDTPVRTITGEDILTEPAINVVTPVEGVFSRSIKVEGGPDNKTVSEFNGPIIVNSKMTVNSDDGIEANTLFLQGDATVSRNYTVGVSAPVLAGNPGNVIWKANPSQGGTWGYVYTTDNAWRAMGPISLSKELSIFTFDQLGIATNTPGLNLLQVGSGTSLFAVDEDGVGIGTTANGYALHVIGGTNVSGVVTATKFVGDGSLLSNVNVSAAGWTNITGATPILYNTDLNEVGIGTSVATGSDVTIGAVGSAGTSLLVNGEARFAGIVTANDVTVTGFTTVTGDYAIENTGGQIIAGIITTTDLSVGNFKITGNQIGVGTATPRALLDVEGVLRTTALAENVDNSDIDVTGGAGNRKVVLDLAKSSVFEITVDNIVDVFELRNPPSDGGTFTLKVTQNGTGGFAVDVDSFKDLNLTNPIPVYWPGGVVPIVTTTANRTDIYSFKFFDGSSITTAGLYGVVGGQNFS
jgi:hypothetical protein